MKGQRLYIYGCIALACTIGSVIAGEGRREFLPAGRWPDPQNSFTSSGRLIGTEAGLILQPGRVDNDIPAIRMLLSNGQEYGQWELPIDLAYYNRATLAAGTADGNTVCLLHNGRMSWFLPDGEYLRQTELNPGIAPEADILDMGYEPDTGRIIICEQEHPSGQVLLHEYNQDGSQVLQSTVNVPVSADTVFMTAAGKELLIGSCAGDEVRLHYRDGTPVTPEGGMGIDTAGRLLARIETALDYLKVLGPEDLYLPVTDILVMSNTFWLSTPDILYHFDDNGSLIRAVLQQTPAGAYVLADRYAGELPGGTIYCSYSAWGYAEHDLAGGLRYMHFWRALIPKADEVYDAVIDSGSNWWVLLKEGSDGDDMAVDDSGGIAVKVMSAGGTELGHFKIAEIEAPFSFIRNQSGPVAVVGRRRVYYFDGEPGVQTIQEWYHGLATGAYSEVTGVAGSNGYIYLAERDSRTKVGLRNVQVYDEQGTVTGALHFEASFLDIDYQGGLRALRIPRGFETRKVRKYSIVHVNADNSISEESALKTPESIFYPIAFITHHSGMIIIADNQGCVRFGARGAEAAGTEEKFSIQIKPSNSGTIIEYNPDTQTLIFHGEPLQRKPALWRRNKLIKLGRKLADNPERVYQKAGMLKTFKNPVLKISITDYRDNKTPLTIKLECGVKKIRLDEVGLEYMAAEWGGQPIALGRVEYHGTWTATLTAAELREFRVTGDCSGIAEASCGDINKVSVTGKTRDATVRARDTIKTVISDGVMQNVLLRSGISPFGFSGNSGDIQTIVTKTYYEDCAFIACADEGKTPGWSGRENTDGETYRGSIRTLSSLAQEEEEHVLLRGESSVEQASLSRAGKAKECTIVTQRAVRRMLVELEDSTYIINGQRQ